MTPAPEDPCVPVTPEQLAAYTDGELDGPARRRVEAWLVHHPDAAAAVEAQQRFQALWQGAAPAEPGEADWQSVLDRVQLSLLDARARRSRRLRAVAGLLGGAAAALALLAWGLTRPGPSADPDVTAPAEVAHEGPLPVLTGDEVEIHSMAAADVEALVVGKPPVEETLLLAGAHDITDVRIQREGDSPVPEEWLPEGTMPETWVPPSGGTPMIVVPLPNEATKPQ